MAGGRYKLYCCCVDQPVVMISPTWCSLWLVTSVSCLVVRQPDGIISIITELEPERVPVEYVQAVGTSRAKQHSARDVPLVDDEVFRVRSTKIRVVDPKTGFKVVHQSPVPDLDVEEKVVNEEKDPQIQALPASNYKVIYPTIELEELDNQRNNRRFGKENKHRQHLEQPRKSGSYGYQYPKRTNTVRTEKLTRIKNDDHPAKVYKQTIVRPATQEDEFKERGQYGKPGRYGKYAQQERIIHPKPAIGEVVDSYHDGVEVSPLQDPRRRKSQKDYSSKTVVRFPDGYAHGNERRSESSSKYRTGTNTRSNYETPKVTNEKHSNRKYDGKETPTSINDKIESDQPIQEGSTLLLSGISDGVDDGLVEGGGESYSGGGYHGYGDERDNYGGGYGKEKHFEKEKGKDYVAAHNSAHGAKGQKGYNNEESYAKGENEKHGQDENKGYAVEKEGEKKSHLDKSSQFSEGHKAAEGESGKDYHKEKGHKKGHKKSGFRTVHHKDEFKKNEEFYDEEHSSGDEQKHGHKAEHHGHKAGGNDKKAYLDSGHHQENRGHEGGHEKGHGYNHQKGYHKDKGHSGHYGNEEEYGKKAGHKEGEVHGHSEYGGYH